jgi:ATP-dependent DNA helicase 2 subunit 2
LIVAIQMINVYTKKLKYKRKIYLVTNGEGAMSSDGLENIADKLKSDNIELVVLYASVITAKAVQRTHS